MLTTPSGVTEDAAVSSVGDITSAAPSPGAVGLTTASRPAGMTLPRLAYAQLRREVIDAGLLKRRYGYYLVRGLTARRTGRWGDCVAVRAT